MKKILLGLIILSNIILVNAKELPTIEVGSTNAIIGEEITIPITIKNNEGFTYIGFKIDFDTNNLEYLDSKISGLEDFSLKQITLNKNQKIVMYAITLDNDKSLKEDQKIAELKFKAKNNQDTSLNIEVTDYGNGTDVKEITGVPGKVSIREEVTKEDKITILEEDNSDYIITSSNPEVAEVLENNEIVFKSDGDVTITKSDKDGNVIETKNYKVSLKKETKEKTKDNFKLILLISIISGLLIIFLILYLIIHRKRKAKKNN